MAWRSAGPPCRQFAGGGHLSSCPKPPAWPSRPTPCCRPSAYAARRGMRPPARGGFVERQVMTLAQEASTLTWPEPAGPALRGTLIVLPGRGESPDVYERFGRRLSIDAYRVHAVAAPSENPDRVREELQSLLAGSDATVPRVVVGSDAGAAFAAYLAAAGELSSATALVLAGLPTSGAQAPAATWDEELGLRTACPTHQARINAGGVRRSALFTAL